MRGWTFIPMLAGLLVLGGPGARAQSGGDVLPAPVAQVLARHGLSADGLSVFVQEVGADRPLLAFNADVARNPASVMKLVTTFAALDVLGPTHTWRTEAWLGGPLRAGRLAGDLILEGSGDPFLTTERVWLLARMLRERGLEHVTGDVVIDDSFFDLPREDPGAFDGRPHRTYNAPPSALMVNYQAVRFTFRPDTESGAVRIGADPTPANLRVDNRLKLTGGDCNGAHYRVRMRVEGEEAAPVVRFDGDYPSRCGFHEQIYTLMQPAAFAYGVFRTLWEELGGRIDGGFRSGRAPRQGRPFAYLESPPLAELIRSMNKFSNNVMTRALLLSLGAQVYGAPATLDKGRTAISDWLLAQGISTSGLVVDNGAGLSRSARISARTLGEMLLAAWRNPFMPEFVASLPISGLDGTVRRHFDQDSLAGRLHVKTGLIDHVRAIGGYLHAPSGRTLVVVSLHNERGIHWGRGTELQQALLQWLVADDEAR